MTSETFQHVENATPLSDRLLKSLQKKPAPDGGRYFVPDGPKSRGFGVRVNDGGKVSFFLNIRYPGSNNPVRRIIGLYGESDRAANIFSLADAKIEAERWRELVRKGIDPRENAEKQKRENSRKRENTFSRVAEDFVAAMDPSERKRDEVARDIRRVFVAEWGGRPVSDIDPADVAAVIKKVKASAPHQARNLLGYARRVFMWAVEQHCYGLNASPCQALRTKSLVGKKKARDRFLADVETRALWAAAGSLPYPYGPLFKLLLLTGARKSEIAKARWSEIDEEAHTITVPLSRHKSERGHVIWLSDDAWAIIKTLPRFERGVYLFSTTAGKKPVNGFSKAKDHLDRLMAAKLEAPAKFQPFVINDIRRTMRSKLSTLPIPEAICEMIIGHAHPCDLENFRRLR
jgi:integrase